MRNLLVLGVLLLGLRAPGYAQMDSAIGAGVSNRDAIESTIKRESKVPLKLPGYLPGLESPAYAIVKAVHRSSYDLLLVTDMSCNGREGCTYGRIQASAFPFKALSAKPFPVKLKGSIDGQFYKPVCNPKCGDASIRWRELGFYYSISTNAVRMKSLIAIAESTGIAVPPPPPGK